jgi:hypothetical protein
MPAWLETLAADAIGRWYAKSTVKPCKVTTLSHVIAQDNLEKIDLLKIDVEGMEHKVIAGIAEDDWHKIKQIIVEVDREDGFDSLLKIFHEHGYQTNVHRGEGFAALGIIYAVRS